MMTLASLTFFQRCREISIKSREEFTRVYDSNLWISNRWSGAPESTVERDYAQNWLLFRLSKTFIKMALKGGTGIRKVYIENYRFPMIWISRFSSVLKKTGIR